MKKIILMTVIFALLLIGCKTDDGKTLKIAEQYGLAYAPITIMKEKGMIEAIAPELSVEWLKLSNTAAIREAMVGNDLDIGFMGIPPFIINKHNGMKWQAFTGLSSARLALMANDESIDTLEAAIEKQIILPQPGSIQAILLSMAAERELGDAKTFDNQLISMKHPDGMQIMAQGDMESLHFTSPPFTYLEEENGASIVMDGYEAFGGNFTFIVGVAKETVFEKKTDEMATFEKALNDAIRFIDENREETLEILSVAYDMDQETLGALLYSDEVVFGRDIEGMDSFANFLYEQDYIDVLYGEKDLIR